MPAGKARPLPWQNAGKTHCLRGHPLSGANVHLRRSNGARVCKTCRREGRDAAWQNAYRAADRRAGVNRGGYTLASVRRIPRQLLEYAFAEVRRTKQLKAGAPVVGPKWDAFLRFHPKVRAALKKHTKHPGPGKARRKFTLTLDVKRSQQFLREVYAVIPRHLPQDMRDDIASAMFIAAGEGKLIRRDLKERVDEFVRRCFASDHNRYGPQSLDMPGVDGGDPLVHRIPEEARLWG